MVQNVGSHQIILHDTQYFGPQESEDGVGKTVTWTATCRRSASIRLPFHMEPCICVQGGQV